MDMKTKKKYAYLRKKVRESENLYYQGNLHGARTELTILSLSVKELEQEILSQIRGIK